jgi:hypothetical protein
VEPAPEARARSSADASPAPRLAIAGAVAIACLALVESATALIAPFKAPSNNDWHGVARAVRADFHPGDLIVAAPAWSDPVMRMHLGDLIPVTTALRLDAAPFGRVWEITQRGAQAPEATPGVVTFEQRFGALTVRRTERRPATVNYDFVARWADASVSRVDRAGLAIPCVKNPDRIQCPDISWNFVRKQTVEVDTQLHLGLLAQPVGGARVVVEYPAVLLGREIALATGLHDVWMRKAARGTVDIQVVINGHPSWKVTTSNRSGWLITHVDTSALTGQTVPVRFEITSPAPYARHFVFAAEARS